MDVITNLADALWNAQWTGEACPPMTEMHAELHEEMAYAIQERNIWRRMNERGLFGPRAHRVGHKIGLTSQAIQSWLKVDTPDFGCLLDDMWVADRGIADLSKLLQPRVECELAFVLSRALRGPGITAAHVISATDYVLPALEIVDSRIANWKISYVDTVADNASSGMFTLGSTPLKLKEVDVRLLGMTMRKRGQIVATGAGAACLGSPINAVAWLANKLGALGTSIEAGSIVLSGALGPVTPVVEGDWVEAQIGTNASVAVSFRSQK